MFFKTENPDHNMQLAVYSLPDVTFSILIGYYVWAAILSLAVPVQSL